MALEKKEFGFLKFGVYAFSFLYFLFLVTFLLYVTFFFSLFLFVVLFLLYSFFISLKILHFIPFRVYYILLKQKSKQNASKVPSKYLSKTENRVANVADIILSYTLIGYIFAVFSFALVLLQLLLKQISKQNAKQKYKQKPILLSACRLFLRFYISYCMYSVNFKFSIRAITIKQTSNIPFLR